MDASVRSSLLLLLLLFCWRLSMLPRRVELGLWHLTFWFSKTRGHLRRQRQQQQAAPEWCAVVWRGKSFVGLPLTTAGEVVGARALGHNACHQWHRNRSNDAPPTQLGRHRGGPVRDSHSGVWATNITHRPGQAEPPPPRSPGQPLFLGCPTPRREARARNAIPEPNGSPSPRRGRHKRRNTRTAAGTCVT